MNKHAVIAYFGVPSDFIFYETYDSTSSGRDANAIKFIRDHGKNKTTTELAIFLNTPKVEPEFDKFWRGITDHNKFRTRNYKGIIDDFADEIRDFQGKASVIVTGLVSKQYLTDPNNYINCIPEEIERNDVTMKLQYPTEYSINFLTDPLEDIADYIAEAPDDAMFYVTICSELIINKDGTVGLARAYQRVLSIVAHDKSVYYTINSYVDRGFMNLALGMLKVME